MTKNNPSIGMKKCEFCLKDFNPPAREDQAANRLSWFCCESHRSLFRMGRRLCQSCDKQSRLENQLVCNKCHKRQQKSNSFI